MTGSPARARAPASVLVTGASSGIGRAIAERLLAGGHEVWGTSRDPGRLAALAGLRPLALDLGDPGSIRAVAETVGRAGVDVLVNNAGAGWLGPLEHAGEDVLRAQFQVLFFGPAELTRLLLPSLRERRGLVVNVSSLAARFPVPFLGPYSAAKAASSALVEAWQLELGRDDVAFFDLQLGDFATPFNDALDAARWRADPRHGTRLEKAFRVSVEQCRNGPAPERAARAVERIIAARRRGGGALGTFLQATVAPLLARLLPRRAMQALVRASYGLD